MYSAVYPLPGNSVYWFVLCFFFQWRKTTCLISAKEEG
ncbi:TPA: hypothetical protein MCG72_005332 [Klebsiella pneumoniae]|nr:hypothetical protein [Klebsiella pneumoniae]HBT7054607.1 hypothetical protein [Klebsiella pneumoniae]